MLRHPTVDHLHALGLLGMAQALEDQGRDPAALALPFEDRLALLLDREPRTARPSAPWPGFATPSCASARSWRTSTTAPRAGWTGG